MLQPDFYSISSINSNGSGSLEATIVINPKHAIFAGHFPGQPVVPGVCMLQIIKECLEQVLGQKLLLKQAANIKFLSMLVPVASKIINVRAEFSLSSTVLVSSASLSTNDDYFIKLSNAQYYAAPPAE